MNRQYDIELDSYEELVMARAQEIETGESLIARPNFQFKYNQKQASSVFVGETPVLLQKLGFAPNLVYHTDHFMAHMQPSLNEEHGTEHGHNGTAQEMLQLPKLLGRPLAIIPMEVMDPTHSDSKDYKSLGALLTVQNGDKTEYRLAVMQPTDAYDGCVRGFEKGAIQEPNDLLATKILSYYQIPEKRLSTFLDRAMQNNCQNLLYFDKRQYDSICFADERNIRNYDLSEYRPRKAAAFAKSFLDTTLKRDLHYNQVRTAIHNEFMQYADKSFFPSKQSSHPFTNNLINICSYGEKHSLNDVIYAYKTCCEMAKKYCGEPGKVLRHLDRDFAKAYNHHLGRAGLTEFMQQYTKTLASMDITAEEDIDTMYELADKLNENAPTLDNLGVELDDKTIEGALAIATSNNLSKEVYSATAEITQEKEDLFFEQQELGNPDIGFHDE